MRGMVRALLAAAVVLLFAAIGLGQATPDCTVSRCEFLPLVVNNGVALTPTDQPTQVTVSMKDFDFVPKEIKVKAGTTIIWKNDGAKPHSATAVDNSFDTAIFQPGESKSAKFSTPGTFAYYCQLHGSPNGKNGMVGTVVVE